MWTDPPADAVRQWAFLGAFITKDSALPPEEKPDFTAAYDGIGGKIAWRAVPADEQSAIRLEKLLKDCAGTSSFAAVVLDSPRRQVIQVGIGQGGWWSCRVYAYLNGKKVYWYQGGVGVKPNALRTLLQLEKGPNTLLIRLDETSKTGGLVLTYRGEGVKPSLPEGVK